MMGIVRYGERTAVAILFHTPVFPEQTIRLSANTVVATTISTPARTSLGPTRSGIVRPNPRSIRSQVHPPSSILPPFRPILIDTSPMPTPLPEPMRMKRSMSLMLSMADTSGLSKTVSPERRHIRRRRQCPLVIVAPSRCLYPRATSSIAHLRRV